MTGSPHYAARRGPCSQQQHWQQLPLRQLCSPPAAAGKGFGSTSKNKFTAKGSGKGRRKCPCGSGQPYEACCSRYHQGLAQAANPEALLRSRFSAYALQEVDYLVKTTHKENREYTGDDKSYARSLKKTAAAVEYIKLTIDGPVQTQQLPQAYRTHAADTTTSTSSNSSSNSGNEAAAAATTNDEFLKFSVRWRPRDGGPEELATEVSHFRRGTDGAWLYYGEVELVREAV